MRQAANESPTSSRTLIVSLIATVACAALLVGCSSPASHDTRQAGSPHRTKAPTTTTRRPTTTTTPLIAYQVKRGDTLTTISRRFHVSVAAIIFVNRVAQPDRLTEGQVLRIPPMPPLMLTVTPPAGPQGRGFQLILTGAKPAETVRFEIDSPAGKFIGRPHTTSVDGSVKATYQVSAVDAIGVYRVIASGNRGTRAQASFRVLRTGPANR